MIFKIDLHFSRILGTPTNKEWEGVETLPAYKGEFPKWPRKDLCKLLPGLDRVGIDLLEVSAEPFLNDESLQLLTGNGRGR